jgi:4-coumarate--CoA ligase
VLFRSQITRYPIGASGYGLTETSPTTHILPTEAYKSKVGSIGPLLPNLEARLVIDDEVEAKEGEPGELWVRGRTIMKVLQLAFRV